MWKTVKYKIPFTVMKPVDEPPIEIVEKQVRSQESKESAKLELSEENEYKHDGIEEQFLEDMESEDKVDEPVEQTTDLLQIDVIMRIMGIISKSDGDDYIVTLA